MHPSEIEHALKDIVYIVDTREQDTPALRERLKYLERVEREKLDAGDYSAKVPMPDGSWFRVPVAIERKMNATELAGCYCRERKRFKAEFERAREARIKLYMLVEGENWESIYSGSYRSQMKPQALVASILAWLARYDCQMIFCNRRTTGKLIRDILYREVKESLERMTDDGRENNVDKT